MEHSCGGAFTYGQRTKSYASKAVFTENYIDGKEFLELTEKDVREMVPPIGLAEKYQIAAH